MMNSKFCYHHAISEKNIDIASAILSQFKKFSNLSEEQQKIMYSQFDNISNEKKILLKLKDLFRSKDPQIRHQAFYLAGKWSWKSGDIRDSQTFLQNAQQNGNLSFSGLKIWAKVNMKLYESTHEAKFLVPALEAAISSLLLTKTSQIPFLFQILSIINKPGNHDTRETCSQKLKEIPIDSWVHVLPQIIARSNSEEIELKSTFQNLITNLGLNHPEPVLFPLLVHFRSDDKDRKKIADEIIKKISSENQLLVEIMSTFTSELIRMAASWFEILYSYLEEAYQNYLKKNLNEMSILFNQVFELIAKPPETFLEVSFLDQFKEKIDSIQRRFLIFQSTKNESILREVWDNLKMFLNKLMKLLANFPLFT